MTEKVMHLEESKASCVIVDNKSIKSITFYDPSEAEWKLLLGNVAHVLRFSRSIGNQDILAELDNDITNFLYSNYEKYCYNIDE